MALQSERLYFSHCSTTTRPRLRFLLINNLFLNHHILSDRRAKTETLTFLLQSCNCFSIKSVSIRLILNLKEPSPKIAQHRVERLTLNPFTKQIVQNEINRNYTRLNASIVTIPTLVTNINKAVSQIDHKLFLTLQ